MLEMSPLIDVVLQLLIFFMLSSTFMSPAVRVDLPEAFAAGGTQGRGRVTVTVTADGRVFVDRDEVASDHLAVVLQKALGRTEDKTVTFRGDGSLPYRTVVAVIDAAHRAGATSLDMAHAPSVAGAAAAVRPQGARDDRPQP